MNQDLTASIKTSENVQCNPISQLPKTTTSRNNRCKIITFNINENDEDHPLKTKIKTMKSFSKETQHHNRKMQNFQIKPTKKEIPCKEFESLPQSKNVKFLKLVKENIIGHESSEVKQQRSKSATGHQSSLTEQSIKSNNNDKHNTKVVALEENELETKTLKSNKLTSLKKFTYKTSKSLAFVSDDKKIEESNETRAKNKFHNSNKTAYIVNSSSRPNLEIQTEIKETIEMLNEKQQSLSKTINSINILSRFSSNPTLVLGDSDCQIRNTNQITDKFMNFNLEDFSLIEDRNESVYGRVYLTHDKFNNEYCLLRYTSSSSSQIDSFLSFLEVTNKFQHETIQRNLGVCVSEIEKNIYCVSVLQQSYQLNLETHIQKLKESRCCYKEEELLNILQGCLSSLHYLHQNKVCHGYISPQSILICKYNDQGEIKIKLSMPQVNDPLASSFNTNSDNKFLKDILKKNELYISPSLYSCHTKNSYNKQHDKCKSDIYSLGASLVYASTLSSKSLFLSRSRANSEDMKKIIMTNMKAKYSSQYIEILNGMLAIDEKSRTCNPKILLDRVEAILKAKKFNI